MCWSSHLGLIPRRPQTARIAARQNSNHIAKREAQTLVLVEPKAWRAVSLIAERQPNRTMTAATPRLTWQPMADQSAVSSATVWPDSHRKLSDPPVIITSLEPRKLYRQLQLVDEWNRSHCSGNGKRPLPIKPFVEPQFRPTVRYFARHWFVKMELKGPQDAITQEDIRLFLNATAAQASTKL